MTDRQAKKMKCHRSLLALVSNVNLDSQRSQTFNNDPIVLCSSPHHGYSSKAGNISASVCVCLCLMNSSQAFNKHRVVQFLESPLNTLLEYSKPPVMARCFLAPEFPSTTRMPSAQWSEMLLERWAFHSSLLLL
jgi:hypothetical protein